MQANSLGREHRRRELVMRVAENNSLILIVAGTGR
jgi:hypothetical protein